MSATLPPPPPSTPDDLAVIKPEQPPRQPAGRYGKGYTPNQHRAPDAEKMHALAALNLGIEPDWTMRHLLGARTTAADENLQLEQFIQRLWNQRDTSMCTGFAFARAAHLRLLKMAFDRGLDLTRILRPSMVGIYDAGRAAGRRFLSQPLVDAGAIPAMVVLGMATQGTPADADWPPGGFDAAYDADPDERKFVDAEPPLGVLERASTFVLQGFYQIAGEDDQACTDVEHAIDHGYPVPVGVMVDRPFEDYAGGDAAIVEPCTGPSLGGHMICVVGYDRRAGQRRYRVVNSWGDAWGDGGMFWASPAWLKSAYDRYALTVTPAA